MTHKEKIHLPQAIYDHYRQYVPNWWQIQAWDALRKGIKNHVWVWARQNGKDLTAINMFSQLMMTRVGAWLYLLPTHKQARQVIWDGMTLEGKRYIDFIPPQIITNTNNTEMKITLVNGSKLYVAGSNKFDRIRGIRPIGVVFSEYAYHHPQVYPTMLPALQKADAYQFFLSTPFGENHFQTLYQGAQHDPAWYTSFVTADDTGSPTKQQIEEYVHKGLISRDMVEQEFYCSFNRGAAGSYLAKYVNDMEHNEQIDTIPWDRSVKVHTAWDIGWDNKNTTIFFQIINNKVYIIDYYENTNEGIEHYARMIHSRPYIYGHHIGPHDLEVHEQSGMGYTRREIYRSLGVDFDIIVPKCNPLTRIEKIRSTTSRMYIDELKCKQLIKAMKNYRREWNDLTQKYDSQPLHDDNSDACDALGYLCMSLDQLSDGMTEQQAEQIKRSALRHSYTPLSVFDDPHKKNRELI